jgi:hypothetical protein
MTRAEVRAFIKSGFDNLQQSMPFNSGRISDFNKQRSNEYPYGWLESISVTPDLPLNGAPMDAWQIVIHVANLDKPDSLPEQYEQIIDECDEIAKQLVVKYNMLLADSKTVVIEGISRDPFIKQHADCLTGVILSFELNTWDKSNYC